MTTPELMIVMPVYNEQASVRKVVSEWFTEIEDWTENFVFLAVNDGSTDGTPLILGRLRERLGPRLEVFTQPNQGHGQSCLNGYRIAVERNIPYVFQIDSDGQCDPQYFFRFWRLRSQYDVIYGHRVHRDDGWRRVLASAVLKATLLSFAGVRCVDANVPYRLMRTEILREPLKRIPKSFFLANVGLAVFLRRKGVREQKVPIRFRERYGGEPSVRMGKFGEKALELIRQIRELPKE
jgi:dolichol-phosphate mannosyltransferase